MAIMRLAPHLLLLPLLLQLGESLRLEAEAAEKLDSYDSVAKTLVSHLSAVAEDSMDSATASTKKTSPNYAVRQPAFYQVPVEQVIQVAHPPMPPPQAASVIQQARDRAQYPRLLVPPDPRRALQHVGTPRPQSAHRRQLGSIPMVDAATGQPTGMVMIVETVRTPHGVQVAGLPTAPPQLLAQAQTGSATAFEAHQQQLSQPLPAQAPTVTQQRPLLGRLADGTETVLTPLDYTDTAVAYTTGIHSTQLEYAGHHAQFISELKHDYLPTSTIDALNSAAEHQKWSSGLAEFAAHGAGHTACAVGGVVLSGVSAGLSVRKAYIANSGMQDIGQRMETIEEAYAQGTLTEDEYEEFYNKLDAVYEHDKRTFQLSTTGAVLSTAGGVCGVIVAAGVSTVVAPVVGIGLAVAGGTVAVVNIKRSWCDPRPDEGIENIGALLELNVTGPAPESLLQKIFLQKNEQRTGMMHDLVPFFIDDIYRGYERAFSEAISSVTNGHKELQLELIRIKTSDPTDGNGQSDEALKDAENEFAKQTAHKADLVRMYQEWYKPSNWLWYNSDQFGQEYLHSKQAAFDNGTWNVNKQEFLSLLNEKTATGPASPIRHNVNYDTWTAGDCPLPRGLEDCRCHNGYKDEKTGVLAHATPDTYCKFTLKETFAYCEETTGECLGDHVSDYPDKGQSGESVFVGMGGSVKAKRGNVQVGTDKREAVMLEVNVADSTDMIRQTMRRHYCGRCLEKIDSYHKFWEVVRQLPRFKGSQSEGCRCQGAKM